MTLQLLSREIDRPMQTNKSSQILECYPHGFTKVIHILLPDCGLQRLAHVETVVRKLHRIFVGGQLLLSESSVRSER